MSQMGLLKKLISTLKLVNVLKQKNKVRPREARVLGRLLGCVPPLFNVIDIFVFRCYKGVDQTWMSLNYTPFLLLVKSKKRYGEGGDSRRGSCMLCLGMFACVSLLLV